MEELSEGKELAGFRGGVDQAVGDVGDGGVFEANY